MIISSSCAEQTVSASSYAGTVFLYVYAVRAHCTYPSFLPDFLIYDINAVIKSTVFRGKTITEGVNEYGRKDEQK